MNKIKYTLCLLLFFHTARAQTPNSWNRVPDFPDSARTAAIAFSIDSFGYVGLGAFYSSGYAYPISLWQYNPYTNVWTQKANFPGAGRVGAQAFVVNNKAYVGFGVDFYNDLWEYDPATDNWTQKADFAGGGREGIVAFGLGNYGYAGLGISGPSAYHQDFWKYDPTLDTWTQLNNFPGPSGDGGLFTIDSFGYAGFAYNPITSTISNDMWRYYPGTDTWTQLANFSPDTLNGQIMIGSYFGFAIGHKGYLGLIYDSTGNAGSSASSIGHHFFEYNSISDSWVAKDSFTDDMIYGMACFSIGNKGYAGSGSPNTLISDCSTDFWMYTPDSINTGIKPVNQTSISIYPEPATDRIYINNLPPLSTLKVCDLTGRSVNTITTGNEIDVSALPAGIYLLHIQSRGGDSFVRKFTRL